MNYFLLLLTLSCTVFAGPIYWEIADEVALKASTPEDIKELINAYPILLSSGAKIEQIKEAEVMDRTYVYIGETVCQNEDPRLMRHIVAWSLCQKNGSCYAPVVNFSLPPKDPCAI